MNILLVYPEFPDTFWSFKHALQFIRKKASTEPLGLLTVAAMLPGDWKKRLVDMNVHPLRKSDLKWADYVFISAMTVQRESARKVIARCKEAGKIVVAGGPLFTMEHEQFSEVDYFVLKQLAVTGQLKGVLAPDADVRDYRGVKVGNFDPSSLSVTFGVRYFFN